MKLVVDPVAPVHLHSNMVRFIILHIIVEQMRILSIYIPIWLDLLFFVAFLIDRVFVHLHSNMVRFII